MSLLKRKPPRTYAVDTGKARELAGHLVGWTIRNAPDRIAGMDPDRVIYDLCDALDAARAAMAEPMHNARCHSCSVYLPIAGRRRFEGEGDTRFPVCAPCLEGIDAYGEPDG